VKRFLVKVLGGAVWPVGCDGERRSRREQLAGGNAARRLFVNRIGV